MQTTAAAKNCVIPICNNEKFTLVHKFPADSERFVEWMDAISETKKISKLEGLTNEAIRKRFFICARHFALKEYKNVESRSLNLTAVPSLNLNHLDELHLSKAWKLEKSVDSAKLPQASEDKEVLKKPQTTMRILNAGISQSNVPKLLDQVRRTSSVFRTSVPSNNLTPQENDLVILEPANKKVKISEAFRESEPNFDSPTKKSQSLSPKESPKARKLRKVQEQLQKSPVNSKKMPLEIEEEVKPSNKLLALIEVTSEQYEKLSKSMSTAERNENVESLMSFIDKKDDPVLADNEIELELEGDNTLKLDLFWLRDHCRCDACYDHSTHQRKLSVLDIPDDISSKSFEIQGKQLHVIWNDEHKSYYELDFLAKHQQNETVPSKERVLWDKEMLETPLKTRCRVSMRDYMSDNEVGKKVLESLHVFGVAFIDGVQPKQENTEFVIRQLFPIHKTLFGEMWTFSDQKKDHSDTAYTNIYLGPHNDNTYFNDAAGLQILHCIQFDGTGGENFLIDGFQVAKKLSNENPQVFDRLTKQLVTAEYIEDGRHHKYSAPLIKLDPISGEVEQIRFNLYDRAPFKAEKIRQFYSDLKVLAREFENPENRITLKLQPGTVLIFDNWRVLHGRLSYTGKRTMTGCYVARTEFQSALRVHHFIE